MLEGWPPAHNDEDDCPKASTSPLEGGSDQGARTCSYFRNTSIASHMKALRAGPIGKSLADFCKERNVSLQVSSNLPDNAEALYMKGRGLGFKGKIFFGTSVNALLMGHEIRHSWQHLGLPAELQNPDSAEGQILLNRFCEADARAIEFGVALQTVHAFRAVHGYAHNLIASLDSYQKEICDRRIERLEEICASPSEMKIAMRLVFDAWIGMSPAQKTYDQETQKNLDAAKTGRYLRALFNRLSGGRGILPVYTKSGIDPDYPQRLAEAIGFLGKDMGGNYLTETEGPDFNSPFYTRVCNYQLERTARQFAVRLS